MDDRIIEGADVVCQVSDELNRLAAAFAQTGNAIMADKLCVLCSALDGAEGKIRRAWGEAIDQRVEHAEQATRNMVAAAIAVI